MKTGKFLSAIVSYMLMLQLLQMPSNYCAAGALPCNAEASDYGVTPVRQTGNSGDEERKFNVSPMASIARW